jgi:hypothetical protein
MESWIGFWAQMIAYTMSLKLFFESIMLSLNLLVHFKFISFVKSCLPLQMKIKSKPNLVGSFNKIVVNKGENCLISTSRFMLSLDLDLAPALKNQRKKECNQ